MLQRLALLLSVFVVMALSNAIVPILPVLAEGPALQGAIFSTYFLGASVTVLPAGLASDRIGRVPLIRTGLILTLASGIAIVLLPPGLPILAARGIEGIGAGLFVASALAWTNSQKDHERLSGYFMASLNLGLVVGLLGTGWLDALTDYDLAGVVLFTAMAGPTILLSAFVREHTPEESLAVDLLDVVRHYVWLYVSAVVLVGVTGAVAALYPEFTGGDPALLGIQIGTMNIATIVTVLVASQASFPPVPTIRVSALIMAAAVIGTYFTPLAFPVIGGIAGFVIVAQLSFLAQTNIMQGTVIGLFNTATYAGFTVLPFIAGIVAETTGFLAAFVLLAVAVAVNALTIGRCQCRYCG